MLVLTQAATGLWWVGAAAGVAGSDQHYPVVNTAACVLLAAGLASSVLHLGRPTKAWRAFLGWRRSWLSREIIAFNAAMMVATVALLAAWMPGLNAGRIAWTALAGAAGLVGVFTSSMVYIDTGRPIWGARFTFGNFLGTTPGAASCAG